MERKRWNYIDALRACSLFLIILYHYEMNLETSGLFSLASNGIVYENINLHMAKVGVTLFFMISGFGLMYSSYNDFDIKTFIQKRVLKIFIPFYTVSFLVFVSKVVLSAEPVFEGNIPKWHFIFTLLGIDGYLKEYGVSTFSLGVGEWFIGCMVLMYLCFPFLRKALKTNKHVAFAIFTLLYIGIVTVYSGLVPAHYFFFIKIYDFILGMYFALVLKKFSGKIALVTLLGIILMVLCPYKLPFDSSYINTVFCILIFVTAFQAEGVTYIQKIFGNKIVKDLSKYSYEMFLIHHWGIIMMNKVFKPSSMPMVLICFVIEFVVIFCIGFVLKKILDKAQILILKKAK